MRFHKSPMKKLASVVLAGLLLAAALPMLALAENAAVPYVTTSNVNLRAEASTASTNRGVIAQGTVLNVLGHDGSWYKVKYNDKTGYVKADYVKKMDSTRVIGEGSQGSDVSYLQTVLKELGIYSGEITGNAGPKTVAAIKSFQSKYGLTADGKVGASTWAKVQALAGSTKKETSTTLTATLRKGSRGTQVTELQKMLKTAGCLSGTADGIFGDQTVTAVKAFQTKNSLTSDGIVGKATWAKLQSATAKPSSSVLKEGSKGDSVKEAQRLLKSAGFLTGSVDGVFGAQTTRAVKAMQTRYGLTADGIVGPVTLNKLKSAANTGSAYTALKLGAEGSAVKNLQQALKNLGFYSKTCDGVYGAGTVAAVKAFQVKNGLTADGIAGKATQTKLFSDGAKSSGDSEPAQTSSKPNKNNVQLIEWSKVKTLIKSHQIITVYDVKSGKTYKVRQLSNGNHCDVEPLTAEDTAIIKEINGGKFQWTPRPVWVTWGDYTVAASIHSNPHSVSTIKDNNFNGHVCLHFKGSKTHNGNAEYTQDHQDAVNASWAAANK